MLADARLQVIMDEVGRGTTVKDGLAIAFATVHHLYAKNRCRALFATHFHELTDMLGYSSEHRGEGAFEHIGFFCTDVDETEVSRPVFSSPAIDLITHNSGRSFRLFSSSAAWCEPRQSRSQGGAARGHAGVCSRDSKRRPRLVERRRR